MIAKCVDGYVVECDICGQETLFPTVDFHEVLNEMKMAGWRSEKIDEWENYCPDCIKRLGI